MSESIETTSDAPSCEPCGGSCELPFGHPRDDDEGDDRRDVGEKKKEEETAAGGVKVDPWHARIAAWLTSPAGRNAHATKTLTTMAIVDALGLPDGHEDADPVTTYLRIGGILRSLGYARSHVVVGGLALHAWINVEPRFAVGDIVRVTHGEHRGRVGNIKTREWHGERFLYAIPIEHTSSSVWVNEEHLMPAASKDGSGTGEGGTAAASNAPPARKGLVAAIGVLLTWLLWDRWNADTLKEVILAGLHSGRLFGGNGLNGCEHAHYEGTAAVLLGLRRELDRANIRDVESFYVALFQEVTPDFLDNGPLPLASLTVAATRQQRGMAVNVRDIERTREAAGWLLVLAQLARNSLEAAARAEKKGDHEDATRFEVHSLALQWLVDAAGGIPRRGDDFVLPKVDLHGTILRVRVDEEHLHVALAEAWTDEVLEPLWQDPSGEHDDAYEKVRVRVLDALVSAYAREVPRELAENIAAGKRETARPGQIGGAA